MNLFFEEIKLKNWIPYKGSQSLRFSPPQASKPLTLIRGVNKGGKSAIIRAFKWALYGNTGDLSEYQKPLELLNRDAKNQNDYQFSVTLLLNYEGKNTEITRTMSPRGGVSLIKNSDYEEYFQIKVEDTFLTGDKQELYIKEMLSEDISDFFLFDGEMLQEYKALVASRNTASKLKSQIQKSLRTPHIKSAQDDIKIIKNQILKQNATETSDKLLQRVIGRQNDLVLKETKFLEDKDSLAESLDVEREILRKVESDLTAYGDSEQDVVNLGKAEDRLKKTVKQLKDLQDLLKSQASNAWEHLASIMVGSREEALKSEKKTLSPTLEKNNMISILKNLSDSSQKHCGVCNTELTDAHKEYIRTKLQKYCSEDVSDATEKVREIDQLLSKVRSSDDFKFLRELPNKYLDILADQGECEVEIENLKNAIGASNRKDIQDLYSKQTECKNEIKKLTDSITSIEIELNGPNASQGRDLYQPNGVIAALKDCEEMIKSMQADIPGIERTKSLTKLCMDIDQILEKTLNQLLITASSEIEEAANKMYKKMTVEDSTTRLSIDEGFGLTVLDDRGESLSTSSTGNQIVALSLLHGLKVATGIQGPLLIDTPFGRVDLEHRKTILEGLATMSQQVVLLVHSGEIQENSPLEQSISREISQIHRIDKESDTQSRLLGS